VSSRKPEDLRTQKPEASRERATRVAWFLLASGFWLLASFFAAAAPTAQVRSISSSKQFFIFSSVTSLRRTVSCFAEEVKSGFLQVLGEKDAWKHPILITLQRSTAGASEQAPAVLQVIQSEFGFKVEIDVRLGSDRTDVNLQKLLLRALLVEYAYRFTPDALEGGKAWAEPPWWLVEGILQAVKAREAGPETELFKRMVDVNHVPPLETFVRARPEEAPGTTAQAIDNAGAFCLLQLLLEQPNGHQALANFVRHLPLAPADPLAALRQDFPGLGKTAEDLQKWWVLNLARLATADRYKGLSPEETDSLLSGILQLEIPAPKGGAPKVFDVADFSQYLKLPGSRDILTEKHAALVALSSRANPLYVEIMADYEHALGLLMKGKTRGVKDRLKRVAEAREFLLRKKGEIADYLNWYEATQLDPSTRAFEGYMRVANELETPRKRKDPIAEYLDEVVAGMK
jgi:hypothetical protein